MIGTSDSSINLLFLIQTAFRFDVVQGDRTKHLLPYENRMDRGGDMDKKRQRFIMKVSIVVACVAVGMSLIALPATAATFSIDLTDPFRVEAFSFYFKLGVDPGFSLTSFAFGDAVTNPGTTWDWDVTPTLVGNELIMSASNWDALTLNDYSNPLKEGTILTIDFAGSVNDFTFVEFSDKNGDNLYPTYVKLASADATQAVFSVPPGFVPTILFMLLGEGAM